MKTVMVATDFSERSDRALRRATLLAKKFGAEVSIVHVVDDDQPARIVESEREVAATLLRELQLTVIEVDGIGCEVAVAVAAPFAGIARTVEQISPDLLVMGPHRRRVLRDVFVGTTAERTIRSVGCPVLMVNAPPFGHYRRAMLTTDFSEGARHAAQAFAKLEIGRDAEISILHVFDAPLPHHVMISKEEREAYLAEQRNSAAQKLAEIVTSLDAGQVEQIVRPPTRSPALDILAAGKTVGADLIVVGTHDKSSLTKLFLGSVAEEVLRLAQHDILAVPPAASR